MQAPSHNERAMIRMKMLTAPFDWWITDSTLSLLLSKIWVRDSEKISVKPPTRGA